MTASGPSSFVQAKIIMIIGLSDDYFTFHAKQHQTLYGLVVYAFDSEEALGIFANQNEPHIFTFKKFEYASLLHILPPDCNILLNPASDNLLIKVDHPLYSTRLS